MVNVIVRCIHIIVTSKESYSPPPVVKHGENLALMLLPTYMRDTISFSRGMECRRLYRLERQINTVCFNTRGTIKKRT